MIYIPLLLNNFLCQFYSFVFSHMFSAARTLKEKSNTANYYKEAEDHMFKPREGDNGGDEVFSMDYTPARRKPPIHN